MPLPTAGSEIEASDWTDVFPAGVDAWTPFTPTLIQSGAVTKTVTRAGYMKIGRLVIAQVSLAVTGAGTATNNVVVGIPVPAAAAGDHPCGIGFIVDSSAGAFFSGTALMTSTGAVYFASSTNVGFLGSGTFTAALAAGDSIRYALMYEAAA